ncbi:AAA family ATPase [Hyalangium versicolor]|uniref:AAA family ATPase n=1 Tax=Hyalangium versicolor TaxID=2861190 RepID=UPI001CCCC179|nr:AAA family ATPase [Hyalangium versicolor]
MIQSVRFENFRSLKDVEVSLEPLTVLVGPPASGKTTLLDGFDLLLGCDATDFWRQDEAHPAVVEWRYDTGTKTRVEYPVGRLDSTPMLTHTVQALALDLVALREESTTGRSPALNRTGDNLAGVFASLQTGQRQRVIQELCRLVPSLGDVALHQTGTRTQRLKFRDWWKTDLWFTPDRVSDTVLLLLAYLVLPYQVPPPDLITLDMPERGLPPQLMSDLMKLLRSMSTGSLGSAPIQVVVATSSSGLLKHVDSKEIRVFSRSTDDGAVTVSSALEVVADWRQRLEMA